MPGTSKEDLEKFYTVFPWVDDPKSAKGKKYFELTLGFMGKLLEHPWVQEAWGKGKLKVLEICGGAGFGGIALAKLLWEKNIGVELTVTDLREDALERARKWGAEELGEGFRTVLMDAREVHNLGEEFDLVLMYGLSTPHFDPWELVRLFASVSEPLREHGIFVVDESDRRYRMFLLVGYKWALAEGDEEDLCMSFHTGYDLKRGTCKRAYLSLLKREAPVFMETFMWGLAEVAALTWLFFEEVDLLQLRNERHFILGRKPRRALNPDALKLPTFLGE